MNHPQRLCLAVIPMLLLASCRSAASPGQPVTDRVSASVTAIRGAEEFHFTVEKDSDTVATYTFTYPEEISGLTYAYVGDECTVSFHGLSRSLEECPNGIADLLHRVLCDPNELNYDAKTLCYSGATANFSYRLFPLSDGNVSVIRLDDPEISYYFNFSP